MVKKVRTEQAGRPTLHALYDAKLLSIASGVVELTPAVMGHYEQYAGAKLPV